MTLICVPLRVTDPVQTLEDALRAADLGAQILELRLDDMAQASLAHQEPDPQGTVPQKSTSADASLIDTAASLIETLRTQVGLPLIATCRHEVEGGTFGGPETVRAALVTAVAAAGASYVDLEAVRFAASDELRAAVDSFPASCRLILSTHDFQTRPADLTRRLSAMIDEPACSVVKAAWTARSIRDNLEAFELTRTVRQAGKQAIMLCMGEAGLMSRVLCGRDGPEQDALLTFAALDRGAGTAPGQPTITELKQLYRFESLGPATSIYGVVGWPVGHSLSPKIHNAGFDATGFDGVYLPLPIADAYESFKASIGALLDEPTFNFRGCSVTIPHKANLLRFVEETGGTIEPLSATIGAANTLIVSDDDHQPNADAGDKPQAAALMARNTDYAAILDATCTALSIERVDLAGQHVVVLGAGGAARAAVAGFASCGARVTVLNRTIERAEALAQDILDALPPAASNETPLIAAAPLAELRGISCDVLINTTPIGMFPKVDASPADDTIAGAPDWGPGTVVFDTIYNPARTRLLEQAAAAGCVTITGDTMFVRQGADQFNAWTGKDAPLEAFREALASVD